jgi:hypothetical protein
MRPVSRRFNLMPKFKKGKVMGSFEQLHDQSVQPEREELLRYSDWFLRFIDRDRNAAYRDRSWDLLRALFLQHKADWVDDQQAAPVSTQILWTRTLDEQGEGSSEVKPEQARKRVNDHWPKLVDQFAELEGRFTQEAQNEGFSGLLWPSKNQSSGGNSSTYYLIWSPFGQALTLPQLPSEYDQIPFTLRYHEDQSSLRFSRIGRLFLAPLMFKQHGPSIVRIEGLRRWVPAIGMGLLALLTGGIAILALMSGVSTNLNWSLLFLAAFIYWIYLRPLVRLYDSRITMAHPLFYPFNDKDCQVEVLWDSHERNEDLVRAYNLRLVRYAATCPLCKGKVWLEDGGFQFSNRLVGRCIEEPSEHVFSFDRKLRVGSWLRHP